MKKALNRFHENGWNAVEMDMQACGDEVAFLDRMVEGLRRAGIRLKLLDKVAERTNQFRKWLTGIKVLKVEFGQGHESHWQKAAEALERAFDALAAEEKMTLIGMDELPIFLARLQKEHEGTARVGLVLSWLRSLQQKQTRKIRWIICGSIGLDTFAEQHNLVGMINHLRTQRLGEFDRETARQFLAKLGDSEKIGFPISAEVIQEILDKVGWHLPYYLQLVFHALRDIPPHKRSADYPSPKDVQTAWNELLEPSSSKEFAHWQVRLVDQFSAPRAATAHFLLNCICKHTRGLSRSKLLQLLVKRSPETDPESLERELSILADALERDGYLQRTNSIYVFRSPLLRDFWKRRNT